MQNPSSIFKQSVQRLFKLFEDLCEGAVIVDQHANITWMNEKYLALLSLPEKKSPVIGQPIERIIPNSLMRKVVEGEYPYLLDMMDFGKRTFVVIRLPIRDEQHNIMGGIGFVLYDKVDYLQPLVSKYTYLKAQVSKNQKELAQHRRAKYSFSQIIGNSTAMQHLKQQAKRAALHSSTILLTGETGTGKELLAHAIHNASDRANKNFISINVAAIPDNLLEAELFGTAPGAYTGAQRQGREGKIKLADGGTLFLDEIGDLPLQLQVKLLRVLQEREFEAVGSNKLEYVNVRVIAATSRHLPEMVKQGSFRSDLYYRLNVILLHLPALRDRHGDLVSLCDAFLEQLSIEYGIGIKELSPSAINYLKRYYWPGNVRELRNTLERAITLIDKRSIHLEDIKTIIQIDATTSQIEAQPLLEESQPIIRPLQDTLMEVERHEMLKALNMSHGKRSKAAQLLGISRAAFYDRLKKHEML